MLYYSYFIMLGLYRSYRHPFRQNYLLFPDFTTPLFLLILSVKSKLNWIELNIFNLSATPSIIDIASTATIRAVAQKGSLVLS